MRLLLLFPLAGCLGPWDAAWDDTDILADTDTTDSDLIDTDVTDTDVTDPSPVEVRISGSILTDTLWTNDNYYVLEGIVFVEAGARLTIQEGTEIRGEEGSALVVTRDSDVYARGTAQSPIRFTSALPEEDRHRGSWGGLVLLGNATVNVPDARIEGLDQDDSRGTYGGGDDTGSCGTLEYVEILYAGFEAFTDNELNALTLGGCGAGTIVRNIHVHLSLDDGIEVFGGTTDLKNVLVTRPGDDGLDWDQGWRGRVQFLVIQQDPTDGDNGIEADSVYDDLPRSAPVIYNATIVGSGSRDIAQRGMLLREGTGAILQDILMVGFSAEAIDVQHAETVALAATNELVIEHSLLFDIGADGTSYFPVETGADDDDVGFDETAWFDGGAQNRAGPDPLLPAPHDLLAPGLTPGGDSPLRLQAATPPDAEFWDRAANYVGAVRPGAAAAWWEGWTTFPDSP